MRLLTYRKQKGYGLGAAVGEHMLDLNKAMGTDLDMLGLLDKGEKGLSKTREAVSQAEKRVASGNTDGLAKLKDISLAAPIPKTRKNIVCLGLNYAEHVKEGGSERPLPPHPVFFTKPPTSITGPYDPVIYNKAVERLDYEVELAFVIGKAGKYISKEDALDYIAGYMVFQDISARTLQRQHSQWYRGKSQDTFAPMGPYLVTRDEVDDPQKLDLWCNVNGKPRQKANTEDMIFDVKTIISTLSDGITLEVGDVFATGTPSGVGAAHPLGLLKVGDVIESGVEKLGSMRNEVVSEK
ncbi:fumarylacetoacetate hydrolase family protein [Candidatus Bathyarchaeota archaeon]|nr:fumarylacetoacetate hydrolase family protein [Candidatus Bathyarchaeota archaeon]